VPTEFDKCEARKTGMALGPGSGAAITQLDIEPSVSSWLVWPTLCQQRLERGFDRPVARCDNGITKQLAAGI
jgi:hypothetical protein